VVNHATERTFRPGTNAPSQTASTDGIAIRVTAADIAHRPRTDGPASSFPARRPVDGGTITWATSVGLSVESTG